MTTGPPTPVGFRPVDQPVSTSTSPLRGTATVSIGADAATVYALVSDVTGYGRFSPENRTARWRNGASGPVVGAKFRSWNRRGAFRWFTHCTIETVDHGRVFAFRVTFPPPMPATRWTYRLNPIDDHEVIGADDGEAHQVIAHVSDAVCLSRLGQPPQPEVRRGVHQPVAGVDAQPVHCTKPGSSSEGIGVAGSASAAACPTSVPSSAAGEPQALRSSTAATARTVIRPGVEEPLWAEGQSSTADPRRQRLRSSAGARLTLLLCCVVGRSATSLCPPAEQPGTGSSSSPYLWPSRDRPDPCPVSGVGGRRRAQSGARTTIVRAPDLHRLLAMAWACP
ncbi:hypothetical protein BH23ACT8_BH23ACT8_12880 [soil metagenome]